MITSTVTNTPHPIVFVVQWERIKDLEWACCVLGGSQVEGDEGSVGIDRRQEGVGVLLLAAEGLVHPQTQGVQQLGQNGCPLCDVLPLWIQRRLFPNVWCQDVSFKESNRKCLQRFGHRSLQGLTADILSGKKIEGVYVDAVGLASWQVAAD